MPNNCQINLFKPICCRSTSINSTFVRNNTPKVYVPTFDANGNDYNSNTYGNEGNFGNNRYTGKTR